MVSASTPGVINVTALNSILASLVKYPATLPSTRAPLPASPLSNPRGSSGVTVVPCVITVMF